MNKNIGKLIKEIRNKRKLSQKRFGYKIGLSGKTISAYETGKITPTYKVLEKIATVYETNILTSSKSKQASIKNKIDQIEKISEEIKYLLNFENKD